MKDFDSRILKRHFFVTYAAGLSRRRPKGIIIAVGKKDELW